MFCLLIIGKVCHSFVSSEPMLEKMLPGSMMERRSLFRFQAKETIKNVSKSAMEYQNSEELKMEQYEWLVSITLYLNQGC